MRRIKLENVYNLRELGGIPIDLYKQTSHHQFLRSDNLGELSNEEIQFLKDYGVHSIIDLRSTEELERSPNILNQHPDFSYYHLPMIPKEEKQPINRDDLEVFGDFYVHLLENTIVLKPIFDIFANEDQAVIFHCTAGKDRTGLIAFLLLNLAGVDRYDVLADYRVSDTFLKPLVNQLMTRYPDMPMHLMASKQRWMEKVYDHIESNYHTIENYLISKGIEEAVIERVKEKLIAER